MRTSLFLIPIVSLLLALPSCTKEATLEKNEPAADETITAKTMAEFVSRVNGHPELVFRVNTEDLDRINEHMTESDFLRIVKLMPMKGVPVNTTITGRPETDIAINLPPITVYGSWPGTGQIDWYFYNPFGSTIPGIGTCPPCVVAAWFEGKRKFDPINKYLATSILPDLKFLSDEGKIKMGFEKVNANQLKGFVGITNYYDANGTTSASNFLKGEVEFVMNKDAANRVTGVTFTRGSGSSTINVGGASVNIKSSNFTFTITPQGLVSNIKLSTTVGNYTIWAGGSQVSNAINVGFSATQNKMLTTSFQGGISNGTVSGSFGAQYGPLGGSINFNSNLDTGIELKLKY